MPHTLEELRTEAGAALELAWFAQLYAMQTDAHAVDLIEASFTTLFIEGSAEQLDAWLARVALDRLTPPRIIAFAWCAAPARRYLADFEGFLRRAREALDAQQNKPLWRALLEQPDRPALGQSLWSRLHEEIAAARAGDRQSAGRAAHRDAEAEGRPGVAREAMSVPGELSQTLQRALKAPGSVDASAWLQALLDLSAEEDGALGATLDHQLDLFFETFDEARWQRHLDWCDQMLLEVARRSDSSPRWQHLLVGALTAAFPARDRLQAYQVLSLHTRSVLERVMMPEEVLATLQGLS